MCRFRAALVFAIVVSGSTGAQAASPTQFGARRDAAVPTDGGALGRLTPTPAFVDRRRLSVWKWVAIGGLGGAAIGGAIAAVHVARTDDAFFPDVFVGAGVAVGGIGGGLLGAIAHAVAHPEPRRVSARRASPNVR